MTFILLRCTGMYFHNMIMYFHNMIIYQYCKFLEQSREKISENTCAVTLHAITEIQNLMQNKYALHDDIDIMYQKKFYRSTNQSIVSLYIGPLFNWFSYCLGKNKKHNANKLFNFSLLHEY